MAVGSRGNLRDIIAGGRNAAELIRTARTQPRTPRSSAGQLPRTARQAALEDRNAITRPFTDSLAAMRVSPFAGASATSRTSRGSGGASSSGSSRLGASATVRPFSSMGALGGALDPTYASRAIDSFRPADSGVRPSGGGGGATSIAPGPFNPTFDPNPPPREWTPTTSPDQRRRDAGQTRLGYVDDQEGMRHLAMARNQQAQQAQDAPFNAWAEQQGFGGEYPIALGQYEGGNYAGFRTQGLMTEAVQGRADALMNDGASTAAEARGMADELEKTSDYLKRRELAGMGDELDTAGFDLPQLDALDSAFAAFGGDDLNIGSRIRQGMEDATYGDYRDQLGAWRAAEQGRVESGREFADQVEGIPLHEWARLAAVRDYGIDPNIATGLYDPTMDTKAFKAERDSQYLQQYGLPYSEVQAQDAEYARQIDAETAMAEDQYVDVFNQDVFERTGISGTDLANQVQIEPESLLQYLDSDNYAQAKQVIEDSGGDPQMLANIAYTLQTSDPTLWRILSAEYELPTPEYNPDYEFGG